jgi:peptidoglycan/xylan/chitin deacetylase (PgdA/CDA1 family)
MISLSFDDGWKNQYTRAIPILDKYNLKGTFYIITTMPDYMLREGEGRMSTEDIKKLASSGHEIGAHSQTHPHLQFSLPNKIKTEVQGSKKDLENLGLSIKTFCYPYGRRNWLVDKIVGKSGFLGARLAQGGYNTINTNRFHLEAKCLRNFTTFEEVKSWIDNAGEKWLILVFHQIENNPPGWGIEPELFQEVCAYIKRSDLEVVTIAEGLKKLL